VAHGAFIVALGVSAGCGGAGHTQTPTTAPLPKPPVVREKFTALPCPARPKSTLDREGCAEKALVAGDRAVNAEVEAIFGSLVLEERRRFVQSEAAWLRYRHASCLIEVSRVGGVSLQALSFARCETSRNRAHLGDLRRLRKALSAR
jgi:uncharacterized protein YecT (DUF1311 family)